MSNALLTWHVILPPLLRLWNKLDMYVVTPITLLPAAMACTSKRSASDVAAVVKQGRGKRNLPEEQHLPPDASTYSDICTYWAANPAFDPQRVLLRRLFFPNCKQDQIRVCRFLTRPWLSPSGHTEQRIQGHHSHGQAGLHSGSVSTRGRRCYVQGREGGWDTGHQVWKW